MKRTNSPFSNSHQSQFLSHSSPVFSALSHPSLFFFISPISHKKASLSQNFYAPSKTKNNRALFSSTHSLLFSQNKNLKNYDTFAEWRNSHLNNFELNQSLDTTKNPGGIITKKQLILHSCKLYFSNDIVENITPNFFRKHFRKNYELNLYKFLQNEKIVSVHILACFNNTHYRTLGTHFGYKFIYDELVNWNFTKSIYFKILYDFYSKYYQFRTVYGYDKSDYIPLSYNFDYLFTDHNAPLNLDQFFTRFVGTLMDLNEEYNADFITYFVIVFTPLADSVNHKKPLKNVNSIPFKKNMANIRNIRKAFNSSILPLTTDENFYGKRCYSTRTYIDLEKSIKRVVTDISENKTQKDVYSIESNKLIESFIDEKVDEDTFTRHNPKKNSGVTIRDNKIIRSYLTTKLPLIKGISKNYKNTFNKHIGSFDLETYVNTITQKNEVYAAGFSYGGKNVMISEPDVNTFYLNEGDSSSDVVIKCVNEMLKSKYHKCIFYTHNLGGYDALFILKILADYNKKVRKKYFKMKAVLRDNRILRLEISAQKSKSVTNTIFLVDSLALLPMSLDVLSKDFSTQYNKLLFPYNFVNENTLYYIGETPSIEFFNSQKKNISFDEYNKIKKADWNLKEESLRYLESDLISLLQIVYEFTQYIYENHNVQVSECLTITGIALNIFLQNHYNVKKPENCLALLKNVSIYKDIKQAYYGGLSEVYIGYGENLFYYDVNSLYPFASLNDMPGNLCTYIETHEDELLDIKKDNLFGYFYCDVKTTNDYFGLLPLRDKGLLTYPIGKFSGWWFSPLLELAQESGYEIKIRKGYNFNRVTNVFDDFVLTMYKEKTENSGSKKLIAKLILNALLGRFGMHIDKRITSLIDDYQNYLDIITKHDVYDEKHISDDLILITHNQNVSQTVCEQHGVDYIEVLNNKSRSNIQSEFNTIRNVSVGVSAAVTSYSAAFMLKIKKYILSKGGKIYYTDTDSIVTDIKLPDEYVSKKDLGKFKFEHEIIRGYFISSKLYCLVVWNDKLKKEELIKKSKGVYASSLTEDDFKDLLNNKKISHGIKGSSKKHYEEGFVSIDYKTDINLNPMSYRKRIKIYDESQKWVDTRPLVIGCELSEIE